MGLMRQARWLVALLCVLAGMLGACAPAFATRDHVFSGSFGKAGSGDGEFSEPSGVAVNESTGDVYVLDSGNDRVEYFDSTGTYLGQFDGSGTNLAVEGQAAPAGRFSTPDAIAIDNDPSSPSYGDVYVADTGHEVVDKFDASGAYVGQLAETAGGASFGVIDGLAVDANGTLWVYHGSELADEFSSEVTNTFLSTRELSSFGFAEPGFAADAADDFYVETSFDGISKFTESGELAVEEFDTLVDEPYGVNLSAVTVDLANGQVYIGNADDGGSIGRFTSADAVLETFGAEQLSSGSTRGLAVDSATEEVFAVDGAQDRVDAYTLEPEAAPTVEEESASEVTDDSAELSTEIKPTGPEASYYFQYGTQSCSATPSACVDLPVAPGNSIGSGFEGVAENARLQGLAPETTYYYRVVASNVLGSTEAVEKAFTTQTASTAFALPDGRAWEMVTPPDKYGAGLIAVGNEQGAAIQAAAEGGAITYGATSSFEADPEGNRSPEVVQVISRRGATGSWETQDISTRHHEGATEIAIGNSTEYKLFSNSLALGLVEPIGDTPLPPLPAGAERTLYLRKADGEYEALVTASNVPAGTKFGGQAGSVRGPVQFAAASPDFDHVIVQSSEGIKLTSTPGDEGDALYEWTAGRLQPASVLPGGAIVLASVGTEDDVRRAVSDNGSLVFNDGGHLYLRDTAGAETAQIDAAQGIAEPATAASRFAIANSEETRVFFTSEQDLTAAATALEYPAQSDLYAYEVTSAQNAPLAGALSDLTVDANAGEHANVRGVMGASEDGSYVYFVANGVLGNGAAEGAVSGSCGGSGQAVQQLCNVYEEHYEAATKAWAAPVFVATLSGEDEPDWIEPGGHGSGGLTSRVSANGRYLTFMSNGSPTGYDNRDVDSGARDEEVYLYDAESGRLVCTSCEPTGARPVGIHEGEEFDEHLVDYALNWHGRWVAANIPGQTTENLSESQYQSRFLTDDGRLFFNSDDALVPADVNGTEDVYEYEPAGVGSCEVGGQSASMVYSAASEGCVALISAGTSAEESAFLDASEGGGEVFFLTSARLAGADYDTSYDVYDAHECSASSQCAPPESVHAPPCDTGDGCKPAPSPQPTIFGAPPSATFSGAGNLKASASTKHVTAPRKLTKAQRLARALKACASRPKRKRSQCRANAQRRYGSRRSAKQRSSGARKGRGRTRAADTSHIESGRGGEGR